MCQVRERRGSDVSDIFLSPEAYKATQVNIIAMLMMMMLKFSKDPTLTNCVIIARPIITFSRLLSSSLNT